MRTLFVGSLSVVAALVFAGAQHAAGAVVPVSTLWFEQPAAGTPDQPPAPPAPPAQPAPPAPPDPGKWKWDAGKWKRAEHYKSAQESTETKTFTVDRGAVLSLNNMTGNVTIVAGEGNEVRVQVTRRAFGATDAEARQLADRIRVQMMQHGERIDIQAMHLEQFGRARVDFVITAPAFLVTEVRSKSGDINAKGLSGFARLETMTGRIVAKEMQALSAAKTMSGDIDLVNTSAPDQLVASTVSGGITASAVKARSCEFGTVSGDVVLQKVSCERIQVGSVNGDLSFAGVLDRAGRYEFKTHSGDVNLFPVGKTGFQLDAQTFSGTARSDLQLTQRAANSAPTGERGPRQALRGVYGDGSAEITVVTFSGDVLVGKKVQ